MKSNQFASILAFLLLISTALNAWLSWRFVAANHQLRSLRQNEGVAIDSNRSLMANILAEANAYGKTNPAILPLLQMDVQQPDAPKTVKPQPK